MAFSAQPRKPAWIMNKCLESLDYDVESQDVVFNGIIPEYEEKFSTIEEDITALDTTVQGLDAEIDVLSAAVETKEDVANKTTVVNASSTDTQYPSAKAVYTAIQGGGSTPEASDVVYDNTDSGLTATNVQDAIDELQTSKLDAATATTTYQTIANKVNVINAQSDNNHYPSAKAVYDAIQGGGSTPEADEVIYDNTESGLVADNVQDAIDEIHEEIEDIGTAVQGKLDATTAASTYQTISGMSDYLTTSTASSTYQTISGMSSYLTTSDASTTYQTKAAMSDYLTTSVASTTYQTQAGMTDYLTNSTAASTYQPISGMSAYLSKNEAGSTYQTISDMTNYQTKANMVQSVSTSATAYPSCYAVNEALDTLSDRITALESQIIHLTPAQWASTTPVSGKIYLVDEQ